MDFSDAVVNGISLVMVIAGLVAFAKSMGLTGRALTALSMGVGIAFGLAYQVSLIGVPSDFAGWFAGIIYGLGMGIVTSGLYDMLRRDF
ncbi:hypothetical protein C4588_04180 [Candidatus Parcubacteria bacterium]|jgi:hypothetical protein|nr:MAG: hypothetical protein C4588_04180 [Candidatus Parcubacteria bacterium]